MSLSPNRQRQLTFLWMRLQRDVQQAVDSTIQSTLSEYFDANGQIRTSALGDSIPVTAPPATTRWEPLTNGDPDAPELMFDGDGDVLMTEVPI